MAGVGPRGKTVAPEWGGEGGNCISKALTPFAVIHLFTKRNFLKELK